MELNTAMERLTEIARRIREMREILGYSISDMALKTEVSEEQYLAFESGTADIPFSFIHKCALVFNVELTELLEGNSANLSSYTVTRKDRKPLKKTVLILKTLLLNLKIR